jgi:hypothetical protein
VRKFRNSILAAAVVGLVAVSVASARSSTTVVFLGKYKGTASTQQNGNTVNISATGTGAGTLIGVGKITGAGTGDSSQQPCVPWGGTGKITGAKGTISFKVLTGANGCGDEGGHVFAVKGYFLVTKATGKLLKAKGKLKATGTYNRDDGTFSIKVTGTLTK